MKVIRIIIINPILYTNETSKIKRVKSIKDSMIYNLCLEFKKQGHEPILIAASDYMPENNENFDFKIVFLETRFKKIFKPNCFPYLKSLINTIKECGDFDFIISSEVFSINSLRLTVKYRKKMIVWHELAKHNNMMRKIPSILWYNIVAKLFFKNVRIVPRSKNAQEFISRYCNNVSDNYIDHGVNLDEFVTSKEKDNFFIIVSQLIKRKRIDGIIKAYNSYLKLGYNDKLLIFGSGPEENKLKLLVDKFQLNDYVIFKGQKSHSEIIPYLSKSLALLINTEKDNSMLSIVESIATATPVITTNIPFNKDYILREKLGIVVNEISEIDLKNVKENNSKYVRNCMNYREKISNEYHVNEFVNEFLEMNMGNKK